MQKLKDYWNDRSAAQRVTLIAAFLITFCCIGAFSWLASRTPLALLYGGLDGAQSGAVVAEIEKSGVAYEIRGDTIWVDASQRDAVRMRLAGQNLPAAGSGGYEILDGMSGFGTTSQMFDAAYWRAKEGELARTILALPNIKAARVHLAVPANRGYRRDAQGSASVTVTTSGAPLDRAQAKSMRYLVASGVPGVTADRVTVIDGARGIVASDEDSSATDRAADMKKNVERMLEPHVGPGNAIVELSLELVTESEQLTEQKFDPEGRALISQESEETTGESTNQAQGAVTASSNLPEKKDAQGDKSSATNSETRQRSNFEVSRTTREVVRQPGATRRMTVAVLVNGTLQKDAQGKEAVLPRPEEELRTLRELVASAVGLDEARGDVLTVKSLPFADLSQQGTLASKGGWLDRLDPNGLARMAILGVFILAAAFVALRPALKARGGASTGTGPALLDNSLPSLPAADSPPPALDGLGSLGSEPIGGSSMLPALSMAVPEYDFIEPPPVHADPVVRLRELMKQRQDDSMRLINGWISDKEHA